MFIDHIWTKYINGQMYKKSSNLHIVVIGGYNITIDMTPSAP